MTSGDLDRPIVILGAARSGTTFLSSLLKRHPDIAYVGEPNLIWKRKQLWLRHDCIPSNVATEEQVAYIRGRLQRYVHETGRTRLCEKTPANSMRPAYLMKVLPDAYVIHIIRDGREVAFSAHKKWLGDRRGITAAPSRNAGGRPRDPKPLAAQVRKRIRHRLRDRPALRDVPFLIPEAGAYLRRMMGLRSTRAWGPVFPGMRELLRTHHPLVVYALQWQYSVVSVASYYETWPHRIIEIRYEDLVRDVAGTLSKILSFCDLEIEDHILGPAGSGDPRNALDYHSRTARREEVELVESTIGFTLSALGYSLHSSRARGSAAGVLEGHVDLQATGSAPKKDTIRS